jgi:hypothetical protein
MKTILVVLVLVAGVAGAVGEEQTCWPFANVPAGTGWIHCRDVEQPQRTGKDFSKGYRHDFDFRLPQPKPDNCKHPCSARKTS